MLSYKTLRVVGKLWAVCGLVGFYCTGFYEFIFGLFTNKVFVQVLTTTKDRLSPGVFVGLLDRNLNLPTFPTGPIRITSYINYFITNTLEKS